MMATQAAPTGTDATSSEAEKQEEADSFDGKVRIPALKSFVMQQPNCKLQAWFPAATGLQLELTFPVHMHMHVHVWQVCLYLNVRCTFYMHSNDHVHIT